MHAPVLMAPQRNSDPHAQRNRDIEPTNPGGSIHAPGGGRAAAAATRQERGGGPLALPSGNDNAPRRAAAAPTQ